MEARFLTLAKMPLRKCATRSGFEIPLELRCRPGGREFDRHDDSPWAVIDGESNGTLVVPGESLVDVARDADVVARGVGLAPKDVDKPSPDTLHSKGWWHLSRQQNSLCFPQVVPFWDVGYADSPP
jgi:hypothetical protein